MSDNFRKILVRNVEEAKRLEKKIEAETRRLQGVTTNIEWSLLEAYGASVYNTFLQVETLEAYDNRLTLKNRLKILFAR